MYNFELTQKPNLLIMKKIQLLLAIVTMANISSIAQMSIVPEQRVTMEGQKWGYKDGITGAKITKALYDVAYEFKDNFAIAKKGTKLGYINTKGKEITQFKFDKAEDFVNGFAKVQIGEAMGFIDTTGKEITEIKFIRLRNFQEGFATASLEDIGRTGFIDRTGKMSSRFNYDNAGSYNEGLAWIELKGKVGFLNKNGDEVIKPKYDLVTDFKKGFAIVSKKQLYGCVDKNGKEFVAVEYPKLNRFGPDSALVQVTNKEGKTGIYNRIGKALIPEYFVKITEFQNLGGQLLAAVHRVQGEVFFYINEKAQCVEFDAKVCPEE